MTDDALIAFERGAPEYEAARRAAVWNARTPDRHPDVIVHARSEADVVRAVRAAGEAGQTIGVRSGGHSWAGNHLRDGGMLIDLSRHDRGRRSTPRRDARHRRARAVTATSLAATLAEHDRFFPGGHCVGVGVGGYLLQGGYGWNGRLHGPACMSVEAIDVVTAAGELVRADADAARRPLLGRARIGPRLLRRRHALPPAPVPASRRSSPTRLYLYPLDVLEDVFRWAREIGPRVPPRMELMVVVHRDAEGELEVVVTGPVLADTEEEAREILALLETCPVRGPREGRAAVRRAGAMEDLYAGVHAHYPDDHRYAVDNMWTHAPVDDLLPGLRRDRRDAAARALSHMLWMNWAPSHPDTPARPDMAYSVEDEIYIALYAIWQDPARDDARTRRGRATTWRRWRRSRPASSSPTRTSAQRPARFLSDEHYARLRRDPRGLRPGRALPLVDGPAVTRRPRRLPRPADGAARPGGARGDRARADGPGAGAAARPSSTGCSTRSRPPSRPAGARCPDGVSLRRRAHADAGRHGGDGRLVVRLAPARSAALPRLAPRGAPLQPRRAAGDPRGEGALGDRAPSRRGRRHRRRPRADRVLPADRARLLDRRARRPARRRRSSAGSSATTGCTSATR